MAVRLGVVMDPISTIKPKKDSTLAMLLEAERRGYAVSYLEPGDLFLASPAPGARAGCAARGWARRLAVRDDPEHWFELAGEPEEIDLGSLDIILMRKDPPVDLEYLYATHLLEHAERAGVLCVNRPRGLREANEKLVATRFPDCTPPTLVTSDGERILGFLEEQGDIILKPLGSMGGSSVFRLRRGDPNTFVVIETMTDLGRRYTMAQRFLPEIASGDKRILLVAGEPVPFALARLPREGETRGNLAAGGRGVGVPLTERDRAICRRVAPVLEELGILFAGLDVIGDHLTEVNVTSPTCIRELDRLFGLNIAAQLLDAIEARLAGKGENPRAAMTPVT
jgi:glutathione synthase